MQEIEGALHVHGNHGVPLAFAHAHHQAVLGDTGIIDQNVDTAEIGHHLRHHLLRLSKVRRVGGIALHGHAESFQLRNGLLCSLVDFQVCKSNGGTLGCIFQGNGLADSPCSARNEGDFTG